MSVTCVCTDALNKLNNDKCNSVNYGNQIVKFFFQKKDGAWFDGTAGNDITLLADWSTKLIAETDDKIVTLDNVAAGVMPASDATFEEGNDVPYGGKEMVELNGTITGAIKYLSANLFPVIDEVNNCWGMTRVAFLDNNNWLWLAQTPTEPFRAIEDASVFITNPIVEGIGTRTKSTFEITWKGTCIVKPFAQLDFLATLDTNTSGSAIA